MTILLKMGVLVALRPPLGGLHAIKTLTYTQRGQGSETLLVRLYKGTWTPAIECDRIAQMTQD